MREAKFEDIQVTKHVMLGEKVTCDLCKTDDEDEYYFPIVVSIDEGACVSTRVVRDVCQFCYDTVLAVPMQAVLDLLKEDDVDLNEANEDR